MIGRLGFNANIKEADQFVPSAGATWSVQYGEISFTDISTNNPTEWLWDFGNGQTSSLQYPTITYANIGSYSVSLTATNEYGSGNVEFLIEPYYGNLKHYWNLNSLDGIDIISGNDVNPDSNIGLTSGIIDQAFSLTASSNGATFSDYINFNQFGNGFSVNVWAANYGRDGLNLFEVGADDESGFKMNFYQLTPSTDLYIAGILTEQGVGGITLVDGTFSATSSYQMITYTNDGAGNAALYRNAVLVDSTNIAVNYTFATLSISGGSKYGAIGDDGSNPDSNFEGDIDEVSFYTKALDITDIQYLYNNGNGISPII